MGLFSAKKTITVASTVYNLAGDIDKRVKFLKTVMVGAIRSPSKAGIGEQLTKAYLRGPGMNLRTFARWARSSHYTMLVGQVSTSLALGNSIDRGALAQQIPHAVGETVALQTAEINLAGYTYWVDRYLANNMPEVLNTNYRVDFDEPTKRVSVILSNGSVINFAIPDYDPNGQYLFASYTILGGAETGPFTRNPAVEGPLPSTSGWTLIRDERFGSELHRTYEKYGQATQDPGSDKARVLREEMLQVTRDNGSTAYQTGYQYNTVQSWSPMKVMIYPRGSGNPTLDAMFNPKISEAAFLPYIPVRIDNNFIGTDRLPEVYQRSKKAVKKAIDGSFDEIVEKIADNDSLKDIDYAYIVFGVSLNTKENAAKRYLYEFFQEIMLGQDLSGAGYLAWKREWQAAQQQNERWQEWRAAQIIEGDPLFGTPDPGMATYPQPPAVSVQINTPSVTFMNYDMQIYWSGVTESSGSGQKNKVGELWWEIVGSEVFTQVGYTEGYPVPYDAYQMDHLRLNWQVDHDTWRALDIYGLNHRNVIYGGKAVETGAIQALGMAEESGFIIPIHEGIYRRMPLVEATQMSTACCYLVFNSYTIVKQKWYQTDWFKILLVIIIIVITIWTGGLGGSSIGLLGTNAAVGAALGAVGTAAIIIGAIANALAAMILAQIISTASTAIFGEQVGAIVAVIASVIAIQAGTAYFNGTSMAANMGNLMSAENIMKLTVAAGNGYSEYMKAGAQESMNKTQELLAEYADESQKLVEAYQQNLGGTGLDTDLSWFIEPPEAFFTRTLMTGMDVADLSLNMVGQFSDITLSTDLAI